MNVDMAKSESIRNRIMQLCEEREWSLYRLSIESGIPHSTLHNMLHRNTPSILSIRKMCDAFGITMSQFFSIDGKIYNMTDDQIEMLNIYNCLDKKEKKATKAFMENAFKYKEHSCNSEITSIE